MKIQCAYQVMLQLEPNTPEWDQDAERIRRAVLKLNALCDELTAQGYDKCLYDKPTCDLDTDSFCWCCPSKVSHWRKARQEVLTW